MSNQSQGAAVKQQPTTAPAVGTVRTTVTRGGHAKPKNWPLDKLNLVNSAAAALGVDLAQTALQVQAGVSPAQQGPFDQELVLAVEATWPSGGSYSNVMTYKGFSQDGVDEVMRKLGHHFAALNQQAT